MLEPEIALFFSERKEEWLKKNLKSDMAEFEKNKIVEACEEKFSLECWLPYAAKQAGQMSISTHPCTFSHPSARKNKNGYVTSIIANAPRSADGYLRSGNANVELDALGNAAVLAVYDFLSIVTKDKRTVLEHIQNDTELAKSLLSIEAESYANLKNGFMELISSDETMITSSKIKQVYFPMGGDYHLVSIVSNSGMIFELCKRIDELRFSEENKVQRELRRHNAYSESGYREIYNITTIGYGGTKPQNISVLNNQAGGKSHLLMSVPPMLDHREVNFPTKDFFIQNLHYYECKEILDRFDNILKIERDGRISLDRIRKGRDNCLSDILDVILQKMMVLREISVKQFYAESNKLPAWQKIWLSEQNKEERLENVDWLDKLCEQIALWINRAYKTTVKSSVMLGEAELSYIKGFIYENREVLR